MTASRCSQTNLKICRVDQRIVHALDSRPGAPLEIFNVIFSEDALMEDLQLLVFGELVQYRATLTGAAFDCMEAECRRVWRESQEQRAGYWLVMRGALERILVEAVRSTGARESAAMPRSADPRRKVGRALTFIHHHFREPVTLAQAARQAQLSPHYFSECFHGATGIPFQRYLCELRLRFASSLLAVSDTSITHLCFRLLQPLQLRARVQSALRPVASYLPGANQGSRLTAAETSRFPRQAHEAWTDGREPKLGHGCSVCKG